MASTSLDENLQPKSSDDALQPKSSVESLQTKSSDDSSQPKSSDDTLQPKSSGDSSQPNSSEDTLQPKSSNESVQPKSSDDSSQPNSSDDSSQPNSSGESVQPKSSDDSSQSNPSPTVELGGREDIFEAVFKCILGRNADSVFPPELTFVILDNLTLHDLGPLRLVSHQLNDFIAREVWPRKKTMYVCMRPGTLYGRPQSSVDVYSLADTSMLGALLPKRHPNLRKLSIRQYHHDDPFAMVNRLYENSLKLTHIQLDDFKITNDLMRQLAEAQPHLRTIDFHLTPFNGEGLEFFPKLERVWIKNDKRLDMSVLVKVLQTLVERGQPLKSLLLNTWYGFGYYQMLSFALENLPELEHLQLDMMYKLQDVFLNKIVATELQSLLLNGVMFPKDQCEYFYLKMFEQPLCKLKRLHINARNNVLPPALLQHIAGNSPQLKDVYLNLSSDFSEYLDIFMSMPNLRMLRLRGGGIKTEHVLQLVGRRPFLWRLALDHFDDKDTKKLLWTEEEGVQLYRQLCDMFAEQKREGLLELFLPLPAPSQEEVATAQAEIQKHQLQVLHSGEFEPFFKKYFHNLNVQLNLVVIGRKVGYHY